MGDREREIVEPSNVVISSASVASSSSAKGFRSSVRGDLSKPVDSRGRTLLDEIICRIGNFTFLHRRETKR